MKKNPPMIVQARPLVLGDTIIFDADIIWQFLNSIADAELISNMRRLVTAVSLLQQHNGDQDAEWLYWYIIHEIERLAHEAEKVIQKKAALE